MAPVRANCSSLGADPSRVTPPDWVAVRYLLHVSRDHRVPASTCHLASPDCQRRMILFIFIRGTPETPSLHGGFALWQRSSVTGLELVMIDTHASCSLNLGRREYHLNPHNEAISLLECEINHVVNASHG